MNLVCAVVSPIVNEPVSSVLKLNVDPLQAAGGDAVKGRRSVYGTLQSMQSRRRAALRGGRSGQRTRRDGETGRSFRHKCLMESPVFLYV